MLSVSGHPREFAQVFYDVLQIHQWSYECVGILHRDLSSGNIIMSSDARMARYMEC
ncbi:hypothetical protein C8R41DRAFT_808912 [Lentinula lateritia]|uniref:Protein kinase domain-containing protein n=1 Tax=Lentinula lateritia TaxID=40482 RepID=A0ABQ8VWM1_9AGAR|nr:hypothetical protein C8R41DRAFT_808912 [Lentinula lateritia]